MSRISDLIQYCGVLLPETPTKEYLPLSWEQILEMYSNNIEIGAHTCTHHILPNLSNQEVREEIYNSKKILENKLNSEVLSFCYPNGNFNKKVVKLVRNSGYHGAVTGIGTNDSRSDLYLLKRIGVSQSNLNMFLHNLYYFR